MRIVVVPSLLLPCTTWSSAGDAQSRQHGTRVSPNPARSTDQASVFDASKEPPLVQASANVQVTRNGSRIRS